MNRPSAYVSAAAKLALAAAASLAPAAPAGAVETQTAATAQAVRALYHQKGIFAPGAPRYGEAGAVVEVLGDARFVARAREIAASHPRAVAKVEAFARGLTPEEISYLNALPSAVSERAGRHVTNPFSELTAAYPVSNDPSFVVARTAAMAAETSNGSDLYALAALAAREPRHPAMEKVVAFTRDFAADRDCQGFATDLSALLRSHGDAWGGRADLLAIAVVVGMFSFAGLAGFLVFLAVRKRPKSVPAAAGRRPDFVAGNRMN